MISPATERHCTFGSSTEEPPERSEANFSIHRLPFNFTSTSVLTSTSAKYQPDPTALVQSWISTRLHTYPAKYSVTPQPGLGQALPEQYRRLCFWLLAVFTQNLAGVQVNCLRLPTDRILGFPTVNLFDLSYSIPINRKSKPLIEPDFIADDEDLDFFPATMAGTGYSSPIIKDEPEESYLSQYGNNHTYPMAGHQLREGLANGIDPSELSMPNGNFGHYTTGSQQNMSFIGDDELASLDLDGIQNQFQGQNGFNPQENGNMQNFYHDIGQTGSTQNPMNNIYSSTPDGTPIQSSFHGSFNYPQVGPHSQHVHTSRASPIVRPSLGNTHGVESHYPSARPRPSLAHTMGRQTSDSRSPLTPKTPGLNGLSLSTPDSDSIPTQPIHTNNFNQYRHQKALSNQWGSTPGSLQSYADIDSPISSPGQHPGHAQISEILKSGKHASLPAKVDTGHHPVPAYQTQEAKRRRRRESHNMVERRRRDNINERIQELSHLVPTHRLEDEKVRKHMQNNSPLSPTLTATGRSPPQATSLLAGGGRRATGAGSISLGIPVEEKDKGPNKGDILNGAVSWTRDLMWALHRMIQQETELRQVLESLGHRFPYEMTDEDQRMRSELMAAMALNDPSSFAYTRADGSGLRVPDHTTVTGDRLSSQGLSPGAQSGGSGSNSGTHGPPYWPHNGHDNNSLKEEDEEYGMDMN